MNTKENNKLIAEFLRANKQPDRYRCKQNNCRCNIDADVCEYEMYGIIECIEDGEDEKHFYHPEEMLFHTWGWLKPVVEKIESFKYVDGSAKYNVRIERCSVDIIDNYTSTTFIGVDADSKDIAVYKAIVEFIEWYNEQDRFICGVCGDHVNEYTYNEDKDVDECNKCK